MNVATTETWTGLQFSSLHTKSEASQGPVAGTLRGCGIRNKWGEGVRQSRWDLGRHVWEGLLAATFPHALNLFVLKSEYPEAAVQHDEVPQPISRERRRLVLTEGPLEEAMHLQPHTAWVVSGSWRQMCLSWEIHMKWTEQTLALTLASPFHTNPVCLPQYREAFLGQLLYAQSWMLVRGEIGERREESKGPERTCQGHEPNYRIIMETMDSFPSHRRLEGQKQHFVSCKTFALKKKHTWFCFSIKTIFGIQILTQVNYFCCCDNTYKTELREKWLIWVQSITAEWVWSSWSYSSVVRKQRDRCWCSTYFLL